MNTGRPIFLEAFIFRMHVKYRYGLRLPLEVILVLCWCFSVKSPTYRTDIEFGGELCD